MSKRERGAIYTRFSTELQESIEDQVRACREWATQNGVDVEESMIFKDEAVSGRKSSRSGLEGLKAALRADKIDVLIVFSTNRLYRKAFKSWQFLEEEVVDAGVRCVCIRSGVDTADTGKWKLLYGIHSIVDETILQSTADHVREAHVGMLLNRIVFGTITFGYRGEEIAGQITKLNKPQRRITINEERAVWVRRIFDWFIRGLSICGIAARLNAERAPWPPRCKRGWTPLAVRRLLSNARYLGQWSYGDTKTVWLTKKDYGKQVRQPVPMATKQFDELRIISDSTFAEAQKLLTGRARCAGRRCKEGTHHPRILNGILWCATHDRPLSSGGKIFFCPECRRDPSRPIYSEPKVDVAIRALCQTLSTFIPDDHAFTAMVVAAFRQAAEQIQRPDPQLLTSLEMQTAKLNDRIGWLLRNAGETATDAAEAEVVLKGLRADRAVLNLEIARVRDLSARQLIIPTEEAAAKMILSIRDVLLHAAESNDAEDAHQLREILVALTGGRIVCQQQGESKPRRGWTRGSFQLHLLKPFSKEVELFGAPQSPVRPREISVDFREHSDLDRRAQAVKTLVDQGILFAEIARRLRIHRSQVTMAIHHWCRMSGQKFADGRTRRSTLEKKHLTPPKYQSVAGRVMELYHGGKLMQDIAKELELDRNTVTQSVVWWHQSRGLRVPDGRNRRKNLPKSASAGQCGCEDSREGGISPQPSPD